MNQISSWTEVETVLVGWLVHFKIICRCSSFHLVLDCVDDKTDIWTATLFLCVHIKFSCQFTKHTAWCAVSEQSKYALILRREDLGKSLTTTSRCLNYQSNNWQTWGQSLPCLSMIAGANPALRFPGILHDQRARCCPPCVEEPPVSDNPCGFHCLHTHRKADKARQHDPLSSPGLSTWAEIHHNTCVADLWLIEGLISSPLDFIRWRNGGKARGFVQQLELQRLAASSLGRAVTYLSICWFIYLFLAWGCGV